MTAMELAGNPTELMAILGDPPSSPPCSPMSKTAQHMPLSSPCSGRRRVKICEPSANEESDIMSSPPERSRKPARSILKRPFNSSPIKSAQDHTNRPPVLRLQEDASSGHVNVVAFSKNDMMKAALAALEANQCPQQNTEYYSSINSVLRMMSIEKRNDYAAMANSLCRCAKRDLMNLKSLSGTVQYQMVTIITRVLIMVLQSRVCIENIDPDVAQWFIGNAITILENESSSKGFVSGQISLIIMQQLDHAFSNDNVARLITVLAKGSRFPSSSIIKDFLRAHIILIQQAPNIMLQRANDWVPTIMDAFVDGNKQIHSIACELLEELRKRQVGHTQVGKALISWADKKMDVGKANLSRFSQLEFSLSVRHRYDPRGAFRSWSAIFVQTLNLCIEQKVKWTETERWLALGKFLVGKKEENIPEFVYSWNAVISAITSRQISSLPSEAMELCISPLNQYFECCSDPHSFKKASQSSFSKLAKLLLCSSYNNVSAKQNEEYVTAYWNKVFAPILQLCRKSFIQEDGKHLADLLLEKAVRKEPSIALKKSSLLNDYMPSYEELPALPPKWLKCNSSKVLQEIRANLDMNYSANDSSKTDTWTSYMGTMGHAVLREMRVREDTIICMADACTFIKEVWDKYQDTKQVAKLIMPFVRAFEVQMLLEHPLVFKDQKYSYLGGSSTVKLSKEIGQPAIFHIWSMIVKSKACISDDQNSKSAGKDVSYNGSLNSLPQANESSGLSGRLVVEFVGYLFKVTSNARTKLGVITFLFGAFDLIEDWRTAAEVAKQLQNEMGAYPSLNASDLVKLLTSLISIDEPSLHDKDGIYRKLLQDACDWCERDKMYDPISIIYAVSQSFVNLTVWRPITVQLAKETLQIASNYVSRETPVGDLFKNECQNILESLGDLFELSIGRSVTAGDSAEEDFIGLLDTIANMWVAEKPIMKREVLASRIEAGLISCLQPRGSSMVESRAGVSLRGLVKICLELQHEQVSSEKLTSTDGKDYGHMVRLVQHCDLVAACLYSQEKQVVDYVVSQWNSYTRKKHLVTTYPATLLGAVSIFKRMGTKRIVTSRSFREQARGYLELDWETDTGSDRSCEPIVPVLPVAKTKKFAAEQAELDSQSDTQLVASVLDKQAGVPAKANGLNQVLGDQKAGISVAQVEVVEKVIGSENVAHITEDKTAAKANLDRTVVETTVKRAAGDSVENSVESLIEDAIILADSYDAKEESTENHSTRLSPDAIPVRGSDNQAAAAANESQGTKLNVEGQEEENIRAAPKETVSNQDGNENQPAPQRADEVIETESIVFSSLQPRSSSSPRPESIQNLSKSKSIFNWFTDSLENTTSGPSLVRKSVSVSSLDQVRSIAEPSRTSTPGRVRTLVTGVQSVLQSFSQSIRGTTPQKLDHIFEQQGLPKSTEPARHDNEYKTTRKRKRELEPISPNVKRRTVDHADSSPALNRAGSTVKLKTALTDFQQTFTQETCTNKELFELETQLLASLVTVRKAQLLAYEAGDEADQ